MENESGKDACLRSTTNMTRVGTLLIGILITSTSAAAPPAVHTVHKNASSSSRVIEVQGHRGARARFPENTLPAFRHAIDVGAHVLELDVVVTSDNKLAVMHDLSVNESICTWTGEGAPPLPFVVRQHPSSELKKWDCGAKPNPSFPAQIPVPGTRIPLLDEVMSLLVEELARAPKLRLNIEAKRVPARPDQAPSALAFARLIVEAVSAAKVRHRVIVQSFDHEVLRHVATIAPDIARAALVDKTHVDAVLVAKSARAAIFSPHHEWLTKDDVTALHGAGIRVVPWTANRPRDWDRLVEIGVDGIITDDPEALLRYLIQANTGRVEARRPSVPKSTEKSPRQR